MKNADWKPLPNQIVNLHSSIFNTLLGASVSLWWILIFGGNIEVHQLAFEALGLPRPVCNARAHPDAARDLGGCAQVQPQQQANEESNSWRNQVGQFLLRVAQVIAHEGGGVHSHEGDERAEIQHLRA